MMTEKSGSKIKQHNKPTKQTKLLRIKDVLEITGISKSHLYSMHNQDLFPKRVHLIPGGTSVAWVESEVLEWIDSRIADRDQGTA